MAPPVPRGVGDEPFTVALRREGAGRLELRLDGRLPVDWAVRLSSGLAAAHIDIVAASAHRQGPSDWHARLVCEAPGALFDTAALRRMVTTPSPAAAARWPAIAAFTLEPTAAGPWRLRIEAADALGFLGELLRALALHGVFARALDVATHRGRVDDVLLLSSMGQPSLSPTAQATLERMLRAALLA
jgi:hypothetical protein